VINADDPHARLWQSLAEDRKVIRFGITNKAEVTTGGNGVVTELQPGSDVASSRFISRFELVSPGGRIHVSLPLAGRHNVMNALAAAAAAQALGIDPATTKAGLEGFHTVRGRLQILGGKRGVRLIDDSYNANPASTLAAVSVLASCPAPRVLVLGDMGELGADAVTMHRQVGERAKAEGIDTLYATGDLARHAVESFGQGARHFPDHAALIEALESDLAPAATILVKGSRFMQMERVVAALRVESGRAQGA
jgi:UDP-N-acetylmuramoyl-tripeptide--D-alanyl-D-alanine ligase